MQDPDRPLTIRHRKLGRREFVTRLAQSSVIGPSLVGQLATGCSTPEEQESNPASTRSSSEPERPLFQISLAQWSLHRSYFGAALELPNFDAQLQSDPDSVLRGELDAVDFPVLAKREFGIEAVEYVNTFFFGKAEDETYLRELRSRAEGEGVQSLLIMCDAEGRLGAPGTEEREETVNRHLKWLDAASALGCHSIRVNAASEGSPEEQAKLAADGLRALAEQGEARGVNVIVENHGGISSNGAWLRSVMELVDHRRIGTLPDFGNFRISSEETYDRYLGVTELMPYARAVSAKTYDFDEQGREMHTDFERMMRIVLDAGYRGYVGIEYEGDTSSEFDGIRKTKALLETVRDELTDVYAE